jgi:hypothetical protein
MGEEVDRVEFTRADRTAFRNQVHRNLDAFARMLREARFAPERPMTGIEIELNLVDEHYDPAFKNSEVLSAIEDDAFQTELGQFNIEINVPPGQIDGIGLDTMEANIRDSLNAAEEKAARTGSSMVIVGILPTLMTDHIHREALSTNPRYALLNDQIFAARGEDVQISIDGIERLAVTADSIVPEAACTSTQFHLQVTPEAFPRYWNAAQAISGVQLAVGANSPFLFGKELLRETRIALFEQAADTRTHELVNDGSPRSSTCSRRTRATTRRCCRSPPTRIRSPFSTAATPRPFRSCGCTTGRSIAGTGPCTTLSGRSRICAWRIACCRPARRSSTRSPTALSISDWSARSPTTNGRSGRRCRSARPRRTSTKRPGTASTPRSSGRVSVPRARPNSC